jgi:glycosyltransferase involved in cell wall biosynthesis
MGDLCQFAETRKIMPSLWSFDYLPDPEDAARRADAILDMDADGRAALSERMRRRFEERYSVAALARALGRVLP